jgi:nicotinate-nucleotide adenylyltransferase
LPPGEKELWLIVGADSLVELPRWRNPEDLFTHANVAVLRRPGVQLENVEEKYLQRDKILNTPLIPISATEIRDALREGRDTREWLPEPVRNYIEGNALYT